MLPRNFDAFRGHELASLPDSVWRVYGRSATTHLVGPAFFDPQVNGYAGVDFQSPDLTTEQLEFAINEICKAGCSNILLTLLTASPEFLQDQLAHLAELVGKSSILRQVILGFHLEGPFLSAKPGFFGAHPKEHLREPDWQMFVELQNSSRNSIRMLTLAPELLKSADFIRKASGSNVFVCLGHSDASYEELVAAVSAGARMFTHLGNGCPEVMHRHDNIIQRVLAIPELMASLIPDGTHLPPLVLSNLVHALGPSRLVMTTDCVSAAGAACGTYRLGDLEITVGENGIIKHPNGRGFAGSSLRMAEGFYNFVRYGGLSAQAAWRACTRLRGIMFPGVEVPLLALPFPVNPANN